MSKLRMQVAALSLGCALGAGLALPAAAQPAPSAVTTVVIPGAGAVTVLSYRAQVVSADPATNRVILEGARGKRWSVLVPPMAGNIALLRNSEHLLIRVVPGEVTALGKAQQGKPGEVMAEVAVNEGLPGWPEGFGIRQVTITTILVNIDRANGTISFEGADGQVRTVKALNPQVLANLAQVQLGDLCQITYVEGLAVNAVQ